MLKMKTIIILESLEDEIKSKQIISKLRKMRFSEITTYKERL